MKMLINARRQILHGITYMWNLKRKKQNKINECFKIQYFLLTFLQEENHP